MNIVTGKKIKKKLLLCGFIILGLAFHTAAQSVRSVKGITQDSSGVPLPGSSVKLISAFDSLSTATDVNGIFRFPSVRSPRFKLTITSISFQTFVKEYSVNAQSSAVTLPPVHLKDAFNQLSEVVVTAVNPVKIKEDTVQYDAAAYPVREGDAVDEMVKRLPGMEVDKDGKVTAQGQPVTKIRLNGKDFFGDDATAALQNLPADIVKNIQLVDDYGVEAKLTGIKSGEPQKILNINTQDDKKNGYFARGWGGLGSMDRYNGHVRGNRFKGDQQISFDATNNNISRGSKGTTETSYAKIDYHDKWGTKIESYGSYRFNKNNNNTLEQVATQSIFEDYTRFENENSDNSRKDYEHNISWNMEYTMDSVNYFKLQPNFSYNSASTNGTGITNTQVLSARSLRERSSSAISSASDFSTELYYNHKFNKKGRNLSMNGVISSSHGDNSSNQKNDYTNTDSLENVTTEQQYQYRTNSNQNNNARLRFSYIEPFSEKSFIEFNYQWSNTSTGTVRNTRDIDPLTAEQTFNENLSNDYKYQFTTNRAGLNYRYTGTNLNYFAGLALMPAVLKGDDLSRNIKTMKKTLNWIPMARLVYKFSKKQSLTARYNGRSNQPGFTQLQPITDNSNIQNVVTGNPDLKPEFTNSFSMEYKQTDWGTGYIMNSEANFNQTNDKIVTTKVIIPDSVKQISSYTNTDGFYNARIRYSISKPFSERKYTLTYFGGSNYSNNIAFTNNDRITGKNLVLNQGVRFRTDIRDVINAEFNTSYSFNQTTYSSGSLTDRNTSTCQFGLEGRTYFHKDLTLGYDFSKVYNSGYNTGQTNPTFLNLFLEYRFLTGNKANIRVQGYDLLNQNTGISRDVFDNVIVDSQSNRLARYFMLSFRYQIQKFGT